MSSSNPKSVTEQKEAVAAALDAKKKADPSNLIDEPKVVCYIYTI